MKTKRLVIILLAILLVFSFTSCSKKLSENEKQDIVIACDAVSAIPMIVYFRPNIEVTETGARTKDGSLIATLSEDKTDIKVELNNYEIDLNKKFSSAVVDSMYKRFFPKREKPFVTTFTYSGVFDSASNLFKGSVNNVKVECEYNFTMVNPTIKKIIINKEDCTYLLK